MSKLGQAEKEGGSVLHVNLKSLKSMNHLFIVVSLCTLCLLRYLFAFPWHVDLPLVTLKPPYLFYSYFLYFGLNLINFCFSDLVSLQTSSSDLSRPCIHPASSTFIPLHDCDSVCLVNLWDAKCLSTTLNWLLHRDAALPPFHNRIMTNSPERLQSMTHKDMIFEMLMRWRLYTEEARARKSETETVRQRQRLSASRRVFRRSWQSHFLTEYCVRYFLNNLSLPVFLFHDFAMSQRGKGGV